ncbi:hypothetical protein [Kitasatospora azatica]|uniref:hypothetical protein n=1 Tax=Kitasatospora azatica TaxID=58347 RepID=UPI00055D778B|nr:hypothetical protein [Kitasatospora azatica]
MPASLFLSPDSVEHLASAGLGSFEADPCGLGGFTVCWARLVVPCRCWIFVLPANFIVEPEDPAVFRPAGPFSYMGRFEYDYDVAYWTGPVDDGFETLRAAHLRAFDDHARVCHSWRREVTPCTRCGVLGFEHRRAPAGGGAGCGRYTPADGPDAARVGVLRAELTDREPADG